MVAPGWVSWKASHSLTSSTIGFIIDRWTLLYFAPVIISFQQMPASATIDQTLQEKAALWRSLNLVRVALFMLLSFALIPLNRTRSEATDALSQA